MYLQMGNMVSRLNREEIIFAGKAGRKQVYKNINLSSYFLTGYY